jgi:hypothetical protein
MKYLNTYKLFESYDESEQWLKEIFLELEDEGYNISIKNSKANFHSSIAMCRTYNVTIDVYKSKSGRKSFKLSDIFEYILTAESYMEDDGWYVNELRFRSLRPIKWFSLNENDVEKLKDVENLKKEVLDITYLEIEFKMNLKNS